jgi:hypothetical protein
MAADKPRRARERRIAVLLGDNVTEFFGTRGNGIQVRALYRLRLSESSTNISRVETEHREGGSEGKLKAG